MRELLAYSQGAVVEEKLTLRIKADNSGNIYLPISGYSSEGLRDCPYDWKVKIDGGNEVRYTGVGSNGGTIRVGYGLSPLSVHTVEVRPQVEDYGWLRAFGYYGTSIASSLINIISDKSYKGYANTEFYTGNWYKAYQYYGCNNLINTDEELLPDTLEIIGDNYRYYEYAGCTSLVHNADEKILKTVKVIGDNYRAYQYQNCTGINKINMRAINWASVGNNYRLNQYSGIGTDRNLVSIYIEGGIEEGGSWGLNNNNIKGIYVYKDLVGDYRTKLSGITSSKIQKNPDWDNFEYEFIEYIGLADSAGKIRIPVGGFSTSFTQDCAYDWMVSIDGGEAEEITGTGGQTYVSVGSGLTEGSEHRVVIKPATIGWGWGRAFGFHTTGAQAYIKEIIHDSYKCYASSRTSTGNHYKHGVFMGCTNLINSYEKLPTSVTSIGTDYMSECYGGCTSLKNAFWEVLHKDITVGNNYRYSMYTGCTGLKIYGGLAGYNKTYPSNYRKNFLAGAGDDMDIYITRYEELPKVVVASLSRLDYIDSYTLYTATASGKFNLKCTVYEGGNEGGTTGTIFKNGTQIATANAGNAGVENYIDIDVDLVAGDVITISVVRGSYGYGYCKDISMTEIISRINENNLNNIYCYLNDMFNYIENVNWLNIGKSQWKVYFYPYIVHPALDINRFTKLVGSKGLSTQQYGNKDLWLVGQISVKKEPMFKNVMVSGKGQTGSADFDDVFEYNANGTATSIAQTWNIVYENSWRWSGGNVKYAVGNYDRFGNRYFASADDDGQEIRLNNWQKYTEYTGGGGDYAIAVSRNSMFVFAYYGGYKRFKANTIPGTSFKEEGIGYDIKGSLMFSDDGLTMYRTNDDKTVITQYDLEFPRDITSPVSTGKSLTLSGYFDMTRDGKNLIRYDGGTIYQYTYE